MGNSGGFVGLLAGVAVGAAVFFSGGTALWALAAFSVTSAAVNYALAPKPPQINPGAFSPQNIKTPTSGSRSSAAAQALQIASSSEAVTIPVVFGFVRLSGNFLRYDRSSFYARPIIELVPIIQPVVNQTVVQQAPSGGKGGTSYDEGRTELTQMAEEKARAKAGTKADDEEQQFAEQIVGYRYYLTFDYGICMGQVEEIRRIMSNPGEARVHAGTTLSADRTTLTLSGKDQGGTVRFYRGSRTQTRSGTDVYANEFSNYRGVCYAAFERFLIGLSPTPYTYTFDLVRMPQALNSGGSAISGFETRGSRERTLTAATSNGTLHTFTTSTAHLYRVGDWVTVSGVTPTGYNQRARVTSVPTSTTFTFANTASLGAGSAFGVVRHDSYYDANPAAILWEVFTDAYWGRGMSHDLLHEDSFKAASVYFADNHLGMSFQLDAQDVVQDAIDSIREHVNAIPIWDGERLRLRVLMDRTNAYSPHIIINSEQVNDVQMSRPSWANTINEIRCEFINRHNNFQTEVVIEQDLAAIETTGGRINSRKISLKGFSTRGVAEIQARRLLNDAAFPRATLSFKMNRFESRLLPGDFVEFVWSEWSSGEMHTFWRVAAISDDNQDEQGIVVNCLEDQYATPYEGEQEDFAVPVPLTDIVIQRDTSDIEQNTDASDPLAVTSDSFRNPTIKNAGIYQTGGVNGFNLFVDPASDAGFVNALLIQWKKTADVLYSDLAYLVPYAISGEVTTAVAVQTTDLHRGGTVIAFKLEDEDAHEANMLSWFSTVSIDADDMTALPDGARNLMIINNEVIFVGEITDSGVTDGGKKVFHADNYLRAQVGTDQAAHADGDRVYLVQVYTPAAYYMNTSNMPIGESVDLRLRPVTPNGFSDVTFDFSHTFTDAGSRPFPPSLYSVSVAGLDWTVNLRPRWHTLGAQIFSELDLMLERLASSVPTGYGFWVEPFNGGVSNGDRVEITDYVFSPDDGSTSAAGLVSFTYTSPASTDELRVYQSLNGALSSTYLSIS